MNQPGIRHHLKQNWFGMVAMTLILWSIWLLTDTFVMSDLITTPGVVYIVNFLFYLIGAFLDEKTRNR